MNKTLPLLGAGVLLGIIATLAFNQVSQPTSPPPAEVVRDIVDIPQMTEADAEQHRAGQYAGLDSIKEVLALPTEFARSEALHVLAGRSDPAAARNLALEANRIADEMEREALLNVVFSRLTELDPQSALLLARDERFAGLASLEDTVWRVWARNDLDDALFAAKTQTRYADQRRAARNLFAAFGYMGNETTDRIEAELGIEPDLPTRARYVYKLADRSPSEAIGYINGIERDTERWEAISWLGQYLSLGDPSDALQYASLFDRAPDGTRYSNIVRGHILRAEPENAIEELLAGDLDGRMWGQVHSAIVELASTDLEAVTRYFEQARSERHRQLLGSVIVTELAKNDPARALAWARENDSGRMPGLEMAALQQIAQTDPQLALDEALASSNHRASSMLAASILQQAAMNDPESAVALLDRIEDRQQRLAISGGLINTWIQKDANAAVEWILGQDEELSGPLMMSAVQQLASSDIDAAKRLLPKLGEEHQATARWQIAEMLGETRSIEELQTFILQYQGQPDYDQLQATAVSAMARRDAPAALQLANQIQDDAVRDSAYVQIVTQHVATNPIEAIGWLENVADDKRRSLAMGQVANEWYQQDPAAATRWVANMPQGSGRDEAIAQLAMRWERPTNQQTAMIASIRDPELRGRAKIRHIYAVMQTDPAKARAMLDDPDIPEEERIQVEQNIDRSGFRF